ncbi:MAG: APC family permease [Bacteroidetes bacterium]|nr:APC family permease [Bacteroidota bacterium]
MCKRNDRVGTAVAFQIFGDASLYIMVILIMVSTFGCNNGLILSGARVYQVMAKDGLFFKQAAEITTHKCPEKPSGSNVCGPAYSVFPELMVTSP